VSHYRGRCAVLSSSPYLSWIALLALCGTPFGGAPSHYMRSLRRQPRFVKGVYTDCGATPSPSGPRTRPRSCCMCRPIRCGPARPAGRSAAPRPAATAPWGHPGHQGAGGQPQAAKEIAEPPITYPGDPDNQFVYAEHGLAGEGLEPAARACHDISVFVPLRVAAAACAEQGQLWRIKANGLPDTANPIWVFEDQVDETGTTGDPKGPGGLSSTSSTWPPSVGTARWSTSSMSPSVTGARPPRRRRAPRPGSRATAGGCSS
jgi:hypothetical protein